MQTALLAICFRFPRIGIEPQIGGLFVQKAADMRLQAAPCVPRAARRNFKEERRMFKDVNRRVIAQISDVARLQLIGGHIAAPGVNELEFSQQLVCTGIIGRIIRVEFFGGSLDGIHNYFSFRQSALHAPHPIR